MRRRWPKPPTSSARADRAAVARPRHHADGAGARVAARRAGGPRAALPRPDDLHVEGSAEVDPEVAATALLRRRRVPGQRRQACPGATQLSVELEPGRPRASSRPGRRSTAVRTRPVQGLRGLVDRVEALGGTSTSRRRSDGTRVEATVPARRKRRSVSARADRGWCSPTTACSCARASYGCSRPAGCEVLAALEDADGVTPRWRSYDDVDALVLDIRMPPTHTDEGLALLERLRADGVDDRRPAAVHVRQPDARACGRCRQVARPATC